MRALVLCIVLLVCSPALGQHSKEIINSIGMKLVLILPGTFTMGSPDEEKGRLIDETQHFVTISNLYYLGAYEVTQGQYEKVMGRSDHTLEDSRLPVEAITWGDAVSFCTKLSELPVEKTTGRAYRLPTEAEWEYACRATSVTPYFFGESNAGIEEYAWSGENSKGRTRPGGEKKANRWGLFDIYGNVHEWCNDWYGEYSTTSVTDPQGPSVGTERVVRGGSRQYTAATFRTASRGRQNPKSSVGGQGFRVAISLPAKQPESASSK